MGAIVTMDKVDRDVQNVKHYARFIISIKEDGIFLINNQYRIKQNLSCMPIIAVVGYRDLEGFSGQQTVILEIGYRRSRPYQQVEFNRRTHNYWAIKERKRVRCISDTELKQVYDLIVQCMADIVLERREEWKNKQSTLIHGVGLVQKGIYFAFNKDDALICKHMLLEDLEYRQKRYIEGHARSILYWLHRYKKFSIANNPRLKKLLGAMKVSNLIYNSYSDKLYRELLLDILEEKDSYQFEVTKAIISIFKLEDDLVYEDIALYLGDYQQVLSWMKILYCRRIFDQPTKHGKNCIEFELVLEEDFRKRNEIPF